MTTHAAPPAHKGGTTQNPPPQGEASTLGENWQQQLAEMLQPAIASIQQQVVQTAEQQLEPLRSRIQQLAEQQLAGSLQNTPQQGQVSPTSSPEDARSAAREQDTSEQASDPSDADGRQRGDTRQQRTSALRSLAQTPAAQVPFQPSQEEESALQRWGETLEGAALLVLALGEVLDGLALLVQALGLVIGGKPSPQPEPSPEEEQEGEATPQEEGGEPSLMQKVGDTVSGGASSLKQAVSEVAGVATSQRDGGPSPLRQWGQILEHAAALIQAWGDSSSSRQGGLSSMQRWGTIAKHATPLVKELNQVLGDGSSSRQGGGGMQRWARMLERAASAMQALGDGSSQTQDKGQSSEQERKDGESSDQKQEDESSSKQKSGGISSALQSLAGGSSSQDKEGGGSSLIDALTGEDSPLQMLREFSKRQQGPGGLAPKGPIGRKPPPGPLRRDRLPSARSSA